MTLDDLIAKAVALRESRDCGGMDVCLYFCDDTEYADQTSDLSFARTTDTGKIHKTGRNEVILIS